jgi:hypothetical protein
MWRDLISLPGLAFGVGLVFAIASYFDLCPVHTSQCFRSIVSTLPMLVVGLGAVFAYGGRLLFGRLGDTPYVDGSYGRWAVARALRTTGLSACGLAVGWFIGCVFLALGRGFLNLAAFALG